MQLSFAASSFCFFRFFRGLVFHGADDAPGGRSGRRRGGGRCRQTCLVCGSDGIVQVAFEDVDAAVFVHDGVHKGAVDADVRHGVDAHAAVGDDGRGGDSRLAACFVNGEVDILFEFFDEESGADVGQIGLVAKDGTDAVGGEQRDERGVALQLPFGQAQLDFVRCSGEQGLPVCAEPGFGLL